MSSRLLVAALALCALTTVSHAQPVPATGLRTVTHDASLEGSGTVASQLHVRTCPTNDGLKSDGTTWVCTSGPSITGSGSTNTIAKWASASSLGNSLLTDDGTTLAYATNKLTVAAATGNATIAGTLGVTGLVTATAGVTTPANLTTTGTGDLVSADALTVANNATLGDSASDTVSTAGNTSLATLAGSAVSGWAQIGKAIGSTTATDQSLRLTVDSTGSNNIDSKTATSGVTRFRGGAGIETGFTRTLMTMDNSTGAILIPGTLGVTGLLTATAGVTTPANLTTTGGGDLSVADDAVIADTLTVNGNAAIGDSDSDAHVLKGRVLNTATGFALGMQSVVTQSGATFDTQALRGQASGTADTTAADRFNVGVDGLANATESAGANRNINVGVRGDTTAGDLNMSFLGLRGDARFNTSSGNTSVGYSATATLPAKLSVSGTLDATGAATFGNTLNAVAAITENGARVFSLAGNGLTSTGRQVDVGAGAGIEVDVNAVKLRADCADGQGLISGGTGTTWSCGTVGIADGDKGDITVATGGSSWTIDAGAVTSAKLDTNIAVTGTLGANGNVTAGDASSDLLRANGSFQACSLCANGSSITPTAVTLVAGNTAGTIGIGASNTGGITIGQASNATSINGTLNFDNVTNAAATGIINATGYLGGTTQFRNLEIDDGKGVPIATFTGATKLLALAGGLTTVGSATIGGNVTVNNDVTLGDAGTDAINLIGRISSKVYYTGSTPAVSACGTGATITGNDSRWKVIPGTGAPTSCTVTFNSAFTTNAPVCTVSTAQGGEKITSLSTAAITVASTTGGWPSAAGGGADTPIYGRCDGWL